MIRQQFINWKHSWGNFVAVTTLQCQIAFIIRYHHYCTSLLNHYWSLLHITAVSISERSPCPSTRAPSRCNGDSNSRWALPTRGQHGATQCATQCATLHHSDGLKTCDALRWSQGNPLYKVHPRCLDSSCSKELPDTSNSIAHQDTKLHRENTKGSGLSNTINTLSDQATIVIY